MKFFFKEKERGKMDTLTLLIMVEKILGDSEMLYGKLQRLSELFFAEKSRADNLESLMRKAQSSASSVTASPLEVLERNIVNKVVDSHRLLEKNIVTGVVDSIKDRRLYSEVVLSNTDINFKNSNTFKNRVCTDVSIHKGTDSIAHREISRMSM